MLLAFLLVPQKLHSVPSTSIKSSVSRCKRPRRANCIPNDEFSGELSGRLPTDARKSAKDPRNSVFRLFPGSFSADQPEARSRNREMVSRRGQVKSRNALESFDIDMGGSIRVISASIACHHDEILSRFMRFFLHVILANIFERDYFPNFRVLNLKNVDMNNNYSVVRNDLYFLVVKDI